MASVNVGKTMVLIESVVKALQDGGILTATGDFVLTDIAKVVAAAQGVEAAFVSAGVTVPVKVEELLAALPLIVKIFSVT